MEIFHEKVSFDVMTRKHPPRYQGGGSGLGWERRNCYLKFPSLWCQILRAVATQFQRKRDVLKFWSIFFNKTQ